MVSPAHTNLRTWIRILRSGDFIFQVILIIKLRLRFLRYIFFFVKSCVHSINSCGAKRYKYSIAQLCIALLRNYVLRSCFTNCVLLLRRNICNVARPTMIIISTFAQFSPLITFLTINRSNWNRRKLLISNVIYEKTLSVYNRWKVKKVRIRKMKILLIWKHLFYYFMDIL